MANFKKQHQVFLSEHDLLFLMVTKTASTSIKHFFYQVENGFPFKTFKAGGTRFHIHDLYGACAFDNVPKKLKMASNRYALVRDPLARLLSCYENKILEQDRLSSIDPDILKQKNLKPQPSLKEFVEHLSEYNEVSYAIWEHSLPLVYFLGEDASWFTRVFDFSEIKEMGMTLKRITDAKHNFPHKLPNTERTNKDILLEIVKHIKGTPKPHKRKEWCVPSDQITPEIIAKVREIYAKDYEVFGHIFKTNSA